MAKEDKKPKAEKITSPRGVFKFPRLNEPDTKFNAMGVYSVKLVLSKEAAKPLIDKLTAAAEQSFAATKADLEERLTEAKGEQKGKLKKELADLSKADLPIKPVYDEDGDETDEVEINFKMNASRADKKTGAIIKMAPKFFDGEGNLIDAKAVPQVWGGTVGKVSATISPFYTAKAGAGASLRLSGVQIIKLVSGGGGTRAEDHGFGKEEDAEFTKDDAVATSKTPGDDTGSGASDDEEF